MREIGFRVWVKSKNKMLSVRQIHYGSDGCSDTIVVYPANSKNGYMVGNSCELMQFTGLFDKNGKEIYEGDIVSAWSTGVKTIGEVKQRNDGMWFIYPPLWHFYPNSKGRDDVEIIGNIYENPELLKEATL